MIVTLDREVEHPRTLFVLEDQDTAMQHAREFCNRAGLNLVTCRIQAEQEVNGRTFIWMWDWPRASVHRWCYRYAGIELSTLVLLTHLERYDRDYLLMRMRGWPVTQDEEAYQSRLLELTTKDYTNEVSRVYQAAS